MTPILTRHESDVLSRAQHNGARLLVRLGWLNVPALALTGWVMGLPDTVAVVGLAVLLCILPTLLVFGLGRTDGPARFAIGVSAAGVPALFVYLFSGHVWQMDLHMYFFPALAALVLLLDKRALIGCTAVIALHHLALNYLAPSWVFAGTGDLPRVLLHAVIVVLQTALLWWLVDRLSATISSQSRHVEAMELVRDEEAAKIDAEFKVVEREREIADRDRLRRQKLAQTIESSIGGIIGGLNTSAESLTRNRDALAVAFDNAVARSVELDTRHQKVRIDVERVGMAASALVHSIESVGAHEASVRTNAQAGEAASAKLLPRLTDLDSSLASATRIIDLIASIAAQSRMLALNATIEASREGSKGFHVVATEMKHLADQTSRSTENISAMLKSVGTAAAGLAGGIEAASSTASSTRQSAVLIASSVTHQIAETSAMAQSAAEVSDAVIRASADVDALRKTIDQAQEVVSVNAVISQTISERSAELQRTLDSVIAELKAA